MTVKVTKPAINLREELAGLRKPTGVAGEAMLRAETPQEQFNLIGAGRRNWIINGSAQISQRGDYTSATSMSVNNYYIDRWKAYASGGTNTIQQVTSSQPSALAGSKSVKILSSSGGTIALGASQIIEDYQFFVGKELTVSGWMKSTNPNARFLVSDNSAWNAVGDAHSGSGSWEFITGTITLSSSATGLTLSPRIASSSAGAVSVSANDYIEFTGVQLELGKVATPFEHRSYGEELALCLRYYYRLYKTQAFQNIGSASMFDANNVYVTYQWPVVMRANPTVSLSSASDFNVTGNGADLAATGYSVGHASPFNVQINFNRSGLTNGYAYWVRMASGGADASKFLQADAEL